MPPRAIAWTIGLAATLATAGLLGLDAESRPLSLTVALLGLALSALLAEALTLAAAARKPRLASRPAASRPADGIVDVVPMAGVEGDPNPLSPRFRRFRRLLDRPGDPPRVGRLAAGPATLEGRVVLISVYVGRDGLGWTDEEIARGQAAVERAGLWIEREAARHAAGANLGLAEVYFRVRDDAVDEVEVAFGPEGDDVGPMEAHATTKAIVAASRLASGLGFADVVDWFGKINPRLDADSRAWLFHIRRSGRSHAIPAGECDVDGVGLALCFAREASFPEFLGGPARVDPSTVAHELLHLFGASDKYGVSARSFPVGSVGPGDIMRLNRSQLSRMTIDRLTASEIGWGLAGPPARSTKKARRRPR